MERCNTTINESFRFTTEEYPTEYKSNSGPYGLSTRQYDPDTDDDWDTSSYEDEYYD